MTGRHPARLNTTDYFGAPQPEGILEAAARQKSQQKKPGRFQKLPMLPAPYVNHLPHAEVTPGGGPPRLGLRDVLRGQVAPGRRRL